MVHISLHKEYYKAHPSALLTIADNSSGQTSAKKAHTYNGIYHYQHTHQLLELRQLVITYAQCM